MLTNEQLEKIEARREALGNRTILSVALDVHSFICGTDDGGYTEFGENLNLLRLTLDSWLNGLEKHAAFDGACKAVVEAALNEANEYIGRYQQEGGAQ